MTFFNNIYTKWFILQLRSRLKSLSFILLLAVMLITAGLIRNIFDRTNDALIVPVVVKDSETGERVAEHLLGLHAESGDINRIRFVPFDDEDEIVINVTRGKYSCAVVFDADFDKRLKKGKTDRLIKFYQSSDSAEGYFVKEIVFSYVFKELGETVLSEYLDENEPNLPSDIYENILSENRELTQNASLSIFKTEWVENAGDGIMTYFKATDYVIIVLFALISLAGFFEALSGDRSFLKVQRSYRRFILSLETAFLVFGINYMVLWLFLRWT